MLYIDYNALHFGSSFSPLCFNDKSLSRGENKKRRAAFACLYCGRAASWADMSDVRALIKIERNFGSFGARSALKIGVSTGPGATRDIAFYPRPRSGGTRRNREGPP